jgi:monofunctional biosynthetic peptidoglycan transglycosylase
LVDATEAAAACGDRLAAMSPSRTVSGENARPTLGTAAALIAACLFFTMTAAAAQDPLLDPSAWRIANDTVMGGVSSSRLERTGEALRFSGEVRLEFNGGFASARRPFDAATRGADAAGFVVMARGDGNRYRLRVYTRDAAGRENAFAYAAVFDTRPDEVTRAELRWPQFAATFRGRAEPEAPPIRFADIVGLGVMITKADHRDGSGSFAVELLGIEPLR